RNVKLLLKELKIWQAEHQYPFRFNTEASVDLGDDPELMDLMLECNFDAVFIGIETPDEASLEFTKKFQNTRGSLTDSIDRIMVAGLRPMAGFIIGFDNEQKGAGERIARFVEAAAIPTTTFGMLQALPHTALWHRLEKEGRLLDGGNQDINQTSLMNFIPTRPLEDIAREYVTAFWDLYEPKSYLDRVYRCFLKLGQPKCKPPAKLPLWEDIRALGIVVWRQGFKRDTRWKFWHHLFSIIKNNPALWEHYLIMCAHNEHFFHYREIVRDEIEAQLKDYLVRENELKLIVKETEKEKVLVG
ncbi:MAG: B12-binding domain-containing radical SAM protein, partial [Microcystaceae cyanobacterium]